MPRELKQETYEDIAAISAFIRRNAFIYGTDLADRLDAAWKRQMSQSWHHREMEELIAKHEKEVAELKKQAGNAAAMHAALRQIKQMGIELRNIIPHLDKNWEECLKASIRIYQTAEWALLEPPRNCDIHPKRDEASKAFQETVLTERERERAKQYPLAVMDWFIDWLLATTC